MLSDIEKKRLSLLGDSEDREATTACPGGEGKDPLLEAEDLREPGPKRCGMSPANGTAPEVDISYDFLCC